MVASTQTPTPPSTKRGRVEDTPAAVLESLFAIIDRNHSLHGECFCPEHRLIKRYREMTKHNTDIDRTVPLTEEEAEEVLAPLTSTEEEVPEPTESVSLERRGRGKVENAESATKHSDQKLRRIADDLRFEVGKMVEVEAVCARLIELAEEEGNAESAELFQAVSDWATGNLQAYMRRAATARH